MSFIFRGYVRLLQRYTLPTQMATGAVTSAMGDIIYQQAIERRGLEGHEWTSTKRMIFYGGIIFAPIGNRWHWTISKIHVGGKWTTVFARALTDMMVFSPFATCLFYFSHGTMEGRPLHTSPQKPEMQGILDRLGERLWPTIQLQWIVFGPAQAVNLTLIPLYGRPVFMNAVSIFWSAFLASRTGDRGTATQHTLKEEIEQDAIRVYE